MTLHGPLHGDFYLSFWFPLSVEAEGEVAVLRVIRGDGYPHDLQVELGASAKLKPNRVFAPVLGSGGSVRLETGVGPFDLEAFTAGDPAAAEFKILCANCFAQIWSRALPPDAGAVEVNEAEEMFWSDPERPGCPRCFAAAAKAH